MIRVFGIPIVRTVAIGTVATIFVWQYIAKHNNYRYSPSLFLNNTASSLQNFFNWCGLKFAEMSGFLTMLNSLIGSIIGTVNDVICPFSKIIVSPFQVLVGYFNTVQLNRYTKEPILVVFGSIVILSVGLTGFRSYPRVIAKLGQLKLTVD
jgi:hypothetical protein